MKIIIPMAGGGQRFRDAGYRDCKPLIPVDGKPMVRHVVDLFPGERDFIFIVSRKDAEDSPLVRVLREAAPACRIVKINGHKKGPVFSVSKALDLIEDHEEVIVNYCDFSKHWDHRDFIRHARGRKADGAVSAYRGFHPHMLAGPNYAFIRHRRQWLAEIREKRPFTDDRMSEYASDGTYYFRRGADVKRYFPTLMAAGIETQGEYYVSMVYNLMLKDRLKVSVYEIQHMLQWGTPRDLEEYQRWSDYFAARLVPRPEFPAPPGSINLLPLAGQGRRFKEAGFPMPKPLIPVSGRPMAVQAARGLPPAKRTVFACLGGHLDEHPIRDALREHLPQAEIVRIPKPLDGEARTCAAALARADPQAPLHIAAGDDDSLWDAGRYRELLADGSVDAVVWTFRRHAAGARNPAMYGWVRADGSGAVSEVSVKKPVSEDPYQDQAVVGTFFFRRVRSFLDAAESLFAKGVKVNGEFYVDSCVNELISAGLKVKAFAVAHYCGWGTPDDLKTYDYWASFFDACPRHPYGLDKDPGVAPACVADLRRLHGAFRQGRS